MNNEQDYYCINLMEVNKKHSVVTNQAIYNDQGILQAIKQLYMSYTPNQWLKLTAGSWATHVGYELVDPYANRNYSMSLCFLTDRFFIRALRLKPQSVNTVLCLERKRASIIA